MSKEQRTIEIAAKLYATRDTARALLGERYAEWMQTYADIIKQVMTDKKTSEIGAANALCKFTENPFQQMTILAAAVEMVEPTKEAA
jgi:hypothetical protein